MPVTQAEKGHRFQALHSRAGAFVLPNPWDAGTARILTSLGFEALTTTSAGLALLSAAPTALAHSRDETLANARAIVGATDLPVAADLENGFVTPRLQQRRRFGLPAEPVLSAVRFRTRRAIPSGRSTTSIMPSSVSRRLSKQPARCRFRSSWWACRESYSRPSGLDDTIRRLQAFEAAGADALYAPGLSESGRHSDRLHLRPQAGQRRHGLEGRLALGGGAGFIGVRRISLGSALSRAAFGAFPAGRQGDSRPRHVPLFGGRHAVR